MEETEKIKEILTQELKKWNNAQLHDAYEYCDKMANDTENKWWAELLETVRQEITERGGRR